MTEAKCLQYERNENEINTLRIIIFKQIKQYVYVLCGASSFFCSSLVADCGLHSFFNSYQINYIEFYVETKNNEQKL